MSFLAGPGRTQDSSDRSGLACLPTGIPLYPPPRLLPESRIGPRIPSPRVNYLRKSWTWLKWPAALAILAYLYFQNRQGLHQVASQPKHWGFLATSFVLLGVSALMTFFRWYLLVWAQEFPFRVRDAVRLGFVGLLFNYVSPGSVGGDIFKAILLAKDQKSRRTAAVATVVLDRVLGLLALFLIGACVSFLVQDLPVSRELQLATLSLRVGSLAGLTGIGLMMSPAVTRSRLFAWLARLPVVGKFVAELVFGVGMYQSKPRVVGAAMAISLLGHCILITGFYLGALALHLPWIPDLPTHFYFMPNAELFGVLIPVPGGVGALEGAVQWFYEQLNPGAVSTEEAGAAGFLAAIAFRIMTLLVAAIGGSYYFAVRQEISVAMEEVKQETA